jgi:hypothetical protein
MASAAEHITIPAPADTVWRTVRDFGSIDEYVPPIARAELSGEGVGAERTLTLDDGARVVERLDALDDDARTLQYSIVEAPLPVEGYTSTLSVERIDATSCRVTWASDFTVVDAPDAEVEATFAELYAAGLEGLKNQHAARSA